MNENYEDANEQWGGVLDLITTGGGNVNVYNYRIFGDYDDTELVNFMNSSTTKLNYHVPDYINYTECNDTVYVKMVNDMM